MHIKKSSPSTFGWPALFDYKLFPAPVSVRDGGDVDED
jgi:hypothetical protein